MEEENKGQTPEQEQEPVEGEDPAQEPEEAPQQEEPSEEKKEGLLMPVLYALLAAEEEKALVKTLAQYPEEIRLAARDYDPSRINRCLTQLAGDFHRFYNACRIKGEEPALLCARLKLADCTRLTIANGLGLLGVTAPVKM